MNKRVNVEVNGKGLLSGQATRQHKKLLRPWRHGIYGYETSKWSDGAC
jgi:hypothetical protein